MNRWFPGVESRSMISPNVATVWESLPGMARSDYISVRPGAETPIGRPVTGMEELHQNEQYFFTPGTLARLTRFLGRYHQVGVLCAPMLGRALSEAGQPVRFLDIDERFSAVKGFLRWDIH